MNTVCVTYSHKQQAFDVVDIKELLELNVRSVIEDKPIDWIILAFVGSRVDGSEFVAAFEDKHGQKHKSFG